MNTVRSIGRYRIEALLGTGAMGEVYRAHDPAIDRPVAIKVVRPELVAGSGGEQLLERFRREARAAGRRFHPNIVAIWDFGDDNGTPFLVMELVEGESLDQLIKSSGPLEPRRSVAIVTQVLSALGFAHASGIVHRDIKPSNIMVLPGDQVKVADFGIARLEASEFTIVGDLLGTPAYMAPEQLSGGPIDHRTDLFATGVILFEMLTGVKPFRGKSITEIISFMENRGPEDIRALNPAVPEAMKHVIGKSVAFDPAQRYTDAAAFSKAVADAMPSLPGEPQLRGSARIEAQAQLTASSAQTASREAPFSAELLRQIERDLVTFIGPMASIAVKRAVRNASDLLELYELLGRHVVANPKDRAEFLARGRQRVAAGLGRPRPPPGPPPAKTIERQSISTAQPPNPASIVAIESDLTRYIGPIARILVKRELGKFESLAKLCLVLATHIPDERERRAFLNAHGAE
ncbi:MAG TPA: serine/threonine-protein kinase [Bradyrhizobium sp.]|nr:serine/threonine-protein kinase [Bradyrhizobium sp.]